MAITSLALTTVTIGRPGRRLEMVGASSSGEWPGKDASIGLR